MALDEEFKDIRVNEPILATEENKLGKKTLVPVLESQSIVAFFFSRLDHENVFLAQGFDGRSLRDELLDLLKKPRIKEE